MNLTTSQFPLALRQTVLKKLVKQSPDAYDGRYFGDEIHSAKNMGYDLPECDITPDAHEIDCDEKTITVYAFVGIVPLDESQYVKLTKFRNHLENSNWTLKILAVDNHGFASENLVVHKVAYAPPVNHCTHNP